MIRLHGKPQYPPWPQGHTGGSPLPSWVPPPRAPRSSLGGRGTNLASPCGGMWSLKVEQGGTPLPGDGSSFSQ